MSTVKNMKALTNQIILTGNLGNDPVIRTLEGGKKVARFSIAHNIYNNNQRNTLWMNVIAWNGMAEQVEQDLEKGTSIRLVGRVVAREYKKDNEPVKSMIEIVAQEILINRPEFDQAS